MLTDLQKLALEQIVTELEEAYQILLMNSHLPDFGSVCERQTKASIVCDKIKNGQNWAEALLK